MGVTDRTVTIRNSKALNHTSQENWGFGISLSECAPGEVRLRYFPKSINNYQVNQPISMAMAQGHLLLHKTTPRRAIEMVREALSRDEKDFNDTK